MLVRAQAASNWRDGLERGERVDTDEGRGGDVKEMWMGGQDRTKERAADESFMFSHSWKVKIGTHLHNRATYFESRPG